MWTLARTAGHHDRHSHDRHGGSLDAHAFAHTNPDFHTYGYPNSYQHTNAHAHPQPNARSKTLLCAG